MKRDMAREAFAGTAGGNGADFGSDFGGASFGANLNAYFGVTPPAAPSAPTGSSKVTTTTTKVTAPAAPLAPAAPKGTTTTTVTKTVVVAPKAPVVSKLTPVHPALQAPAAIKSPFAPSLPFALKPKLITPPTSMGRAFAPAAPIARPIAPSFMPGVRAFAPRAPFVPSAPIGRASPFIPAPTGRSLPPANTYLPPARTYAPERSIWHALNPFNWFRREDIGHRTSGIGYRREGYDQGDSYRAMQRAAEARALADSSTPEQSYYPQASFVSQSAFVPPAIVPSDDSYEPDAYSQSQGVTSGGTPTEFDNPNFIPPTVRSGSSGRYVEAWQEILSNIPGFDNSIGRGSFDDRTLAATKQWQSDHSLTADGIVGPKTWGAALTIQHSDDPDDTATYGSAPDVVASGTYDSNSNPDLNSPQDSVAGDTDVIFAQDYGEAPTQRYGHRHHHRHNLQQGYQQNYQQAAYQTAYMPQQSAFAPPAPPIAPQWSASNPPPPPTGYNDGY